jgi:hypothetical protein
MDTHVDTRLLREAAAGRVNPGHHIEFSSVAVLPKPVPGASVCLSQCVVTFAADHDADSRPSEAEKIIYPIMFAGFAATGASAT